MLVVLAGAAEMERNLTRKRTKSAMAVKRANSQRIGSYGYQMKIADWLQASRGLEARAALQNPIEPEHRFGSL